MIALVWGSVLGLSSVVSDELRAGTLSQGLSVALSTGLGAFLNRVLYDGLSVGFSGFLLSVLLENERVTAHLAERLSWSSRQLFRWGHLRNSLFLSSVLCWLFILDNVLSSALSTILNNALTGAPIYAQLTLELGNGLRSGLVAGLSYSLSFGLSYWLLFGLFQSIVQKQIEAEDRRIFNQGIRRSLRNSLFISLLAGGIITGISILSSILIDVLNIGLLVGLSQGQSEELNSELNYGLSYGLAPVQHYGWLLFLCGSLFLLAAMGGLLILRHYIIRWLLVRSHAFPWQARAFLDDAAARILLKRLGGGYRFEHRLLMEHFARTYTS
jgi:hypothetical protein